MSFAYFASKKINNKKVQFKDAIEESQRTYSEEDNELKYVLFALLNTNPTSKL